MDANSGRSTSALLTGIKGLLACDSGDVVAGIVEFVVSQRPTLRRLGRVMRPDGPAAMILIVLNGLRCYLGVCPHGSGDVIVAARRPNERRATGDLKRMAPDREWTELNYCWRIAPMASALAALAPTAADDWRRTARLARMLVRRYGVFRAMRSVELVAYYRRYTQLLAACPFRLAVMSSHSNPHGIALNLAARRFDIPIVLITHGMPVRPIARLDYDVAIVECDVSRQVYEDAGCGMRRVIIKSRLREYAPMRPLAEHNLTVGVFLSKDPVEARIRSCVDALRTDSRVKRVVVRPHPVNLWKHLPAYMESLRDERIALNSTGSLTDDLRECDLVLAGNSTVLLDAVVAGRPACYVRGFDHGPYDVQDFVRFGLVCELVPEHVIDLPAIRSFYAHSGWPSALRRFADVDHTETQVITAVRSALNSFSTLTAGVQ
jgi:hypothetical protein